jgi:hypothetical protein
LPRACIEENSMTSRKDTRNTGDAGAQREPTVRERSQRQARENAEALRDTRRSHQPGIDDDSEVMKSLVGTLGAPVEGALDSMRERERGAGRDGAGADQAGDVARQRGHETDIPRRDTAPTGRVPTRPEDAEAEPSEIAEDMSRDRPGTERGPR